MNAIGVDVGGTKIAAAVVSPEGEILNEVRYPTQAVPPNRLVDDHRPRPSRRSRTASRWAGCAWRFRV